MCNLRMGDWGPRLTTWFLEGVGQMTKFDHDGGRGSKSDPVTYGCPLNEKLKIAIAKIMNNRLTQFWA